MLQSVFPRVIQTDKYFNITLSHSPALGINPLPTITTTLLYSNKTPPKTIPMSKIVLTSVAPALSIKGEAKFSLKVNVKALSDDHVRVPFVLKFEIDAKHAIAPCYSPPFYVATTLRQVMTINSELERPAKRQRNVLGPPPVLSSEGSDDPNYFDSLYRQSTCTEMNIEQEILHLCQEIRDFLISNPQR
jgi:hypothetical protein